MANRMNPRASIPAAQIVNADIGELPFQERAEQEQIAATFAPLHQKPLRRSKEPLPVAEEIDLERVRNLNDIPQALPLAPLGPPLPPPASPPPSKTFDGLADDGTAIPPDTMGTAGHNHLFNPLNNGIQISDRTGATSLPVLRLNDFWKSLGTPLEAFDPRAIYDPYNRRFLFACMANAESPDSRLLIGVTKEDDPTRNWTLSSVKVDQATQGNVWLDFPSIGFSADKITVQVNMFKIGDNSFQGSSIYVWDRASLYDPPYIPAVRLFVLKDQGALQVPAITYDPVESKHYLVSRWSGDIEGHGSYAIYEITGNVSDGSVRLAQTGFIQTTGLNWDSSVMGDFAPQKGTAKRINTSDDRILSAIYRNGSLWFTHTVYLPAGGPTHTAVQWLQVNTANWSIRQLGRVDDPNGLIFYAFPTLAVNSDEDVLLGLARFSADDFASGAYAYRTSTDALGVMLSPCVHAPGLSTYFKTFGGSRNRWGDYSSTQVDPTDDHSFWTLQEYTSERADFWATKWAHVP